MNRARPNPSKARSRLSLGITMRTALLAWLVTIATVVIFGVAITPELKRTSLDYLQSKSNGVAVSLRDVAASAAVSNDYSSVVDHCVEMIKGDPGIDFLVLTRYDGFSLIHDRSGWQTGSLGPEWRPLERVAVGAITRVPLFDRRVYHFSQPFGYSGVEWGWIHVGLSVERYDQDMSKLYRRTALIAVLCVLLGLAATLFYASYLVRPILALQSAVRQIAGGDLSARALTGRTDEVGQLAESINSMAEALLRRDRTLQEANETLERRVNERTRELQEQVAEKERTHLALEQAQHHLIELSRDTGRAEIATGVLHSVGNVLNSVNVSATLMQDQLARSQLHGLVQATTLLQINRDALDTYLTSDVKGRHLPDYLIEVSRVLADEHRTWQAELDGLTRNIGHIKEIVSLQQSYARVAHVVECVSPSNLVEDALHITRAAYDRNGIRVTRDFHATDPVTVDRHKVQLILVNLLTNAHWATEGKLRDERLVRIAITEPSGRVRIEVRDNGVGISARDMPQIFRHGFTTREAGHGFGLHICALAASEMGGSLTAQSDGPGCGATFTLELPATLQAS